MTSRPLLLFALAVAATQAHAQTEITPSEEYERSIKGAQSLTTLGPNLFGDIVNLKDGNTSFQATDVSVPTNSGLALAIGRQLGINPKDADRYTNPQVDGELFGNWKLDVPVIAGTFDERTGWVSGSASSPNARCSMVSAPPAVRSAYSGWSDLYYYSEDYWSGNNIRIPGKGSYPMLARNPGSAGPTDGKTYSWTTKGNWMISCIPLKNGAGEGFQVTLPDGTKYSFDWMSSRRAAALKDTHCDRVYLGYEVRGVNVNHLSAQDLSRLHRLDSGGSISGGGAATACETKVVVNRREYFLHATKVEDRFGNQVTYNYDAANPRRLTSVASNEGSSIALSYGADGKINTVSSNGRQWRYLYEPDARYGSKLVAVVQPDNSRWGFEYGELFSILDYDKKLKWPDCEPAVFGSITATLAITHPSGARGEFSFQNQAHGVDRTPGGCSIPNPDRPLRTDVSHIQMAYKVASLTRKQITGPGLLPQTWGFAYQPSWSWNPDGYSDTCSNPEFCNGTSTTEVTAPDGRIIRSTFGNDYYRNVGQLQRVEILSGNVVVQRTHHSYVGPATGQAYPARAGRDLLLRNNLFETEQLHPRVSSVLDQDNESFYWNVESCGAAYCFDSFARPNRVRLHNSVGHSRTEVTEYMDHLGLWVLGQVRRKYVPGTSPNDNAATTNMVLAETDFNSMALPWKTYRFGKLDQVLTYAADGTLSAVADAKGNRTQFSDYFRNVPRDIRFPATSESPSGATQSATVDSNGWITAVTDELGAKTCYGYDSMGRVNSIRYPSETQTGQCDASRWASVSLTFQQVAAEEFGLPAGHWRLQRREGNLHVNTYFDALWRTVVEEKLDAADSTNTLTQSVTRFDVMGRPSFASYPQRGISQYLAPLKGVRTSYDALGRTTRVEQDSELGVLSSTSEYLSGLRIRTVNPRGKPSTVTYLAFDKPAYDWPIRSELPEGKVIEIKRHSKFAWPLAMTQRDATGALAHTRRYVYDGQAHACKMIQPENGATVVGHDETGNPLWSASGLTGGDFHNSVDCSYVAANASGRVINRTYDARNRLTALSFPDTRGNQTWQYTPDGLPAIVTVANEINGTQTVRTSFTYNARRLLVSETLAQPGWYEWGVSYGYDALGNRSSTTYPTGLAIDFAPNALGQETKAGSYARNAQYHPNGALKQFTFGNGVVHTMAQNDRQLPMRARSSNGVLDFSYHYDEHGNPHHIGNELIAGYDLGDRWLGYDDLDRLTVAGSGMFGGDHFHRFSYDVQDNLKSWKLAGVKDFADYAYDAQNRLSVIRNSLGTPVHSFTYDAQGNVRTKDTDSYNYDFGNRLLSISGKESYRYDAFARRVMSVKPNSATTLWLYSQDGEMLFTSDWDGPNYLNQKTHEFVYLAGSLVASIDHLWPSNTIIATKYHHTDALGSPVAVTNPQGQVIERNDYEPFGAVIAKPSFSGIGFAGHVMDGATGLSYMQRRYYDPAIGRFLSVDPVLADTTSAANFNRYRYADNSPYAIVDPDGRQSQRAAAPAPPTPEPTPEPEPEPEPNPDVPELETIVVVASRLTPTQIDPPDPDNHPVNPWEPITDPRDGRVRYLRPARCNAADDLGLCKAYGDTPYYVSPEEAEKRARAEQARVLRFARIGPKAGLCLARGGGAKCVRRATREFLKEYVVPLVERRVNRERALDETEQSN